MCPYRLSILHPKSLSLFSSYEGLTPVLVHLLYPEEKWLLPLLIYSWDTQPFFIPEQRPVQFTLNSLYMDSPLQSPLQIPALKFPLQFRPLCINLKTSVLSPSIIDPSVTPLSSFQTLDRNSFISKPPVVLLFLVFSGNFSPSHRISFRSNFTSQSSCADRKSLTEWSESYYGECTYLSLQVGTTVYPVLKKTKIPTYCKMTYIYGV